MCVCVCVCGCGCVCVVVCVVGGWVRVGGATEMMACVINC